MPTLEINSDYVRMLIVKVRALMGKEAPTFPDEGSNAIDDPLGGLQDSPDDQSRREIVKEIAGLSEREQAELVALMWLGRGDGEPEEWEDLVQQAMERREVPTATYSRPSAPRRNPGSMGLRVWVWIHLKAASRKFNAAKGRRRKSIAPGGVDYAASRRLAASRKTT